MALPRPAADDGPAILLPASPAVAGQTGLLALARRHDRPVYTLGRLSAARALLDTLQPDLIVTACFPRLLPRDWLDYPSTGCLNLHPSLLPAYRGPEPLFWQLRAGERQTGVTLHLLDEGVDAGPIVAQQAVELPPGAREATLERLLATAGGALLQTILRQGDLQRRAQDPAAASRQSFPGPAALEVPTTWAVVRAYNFIRGMRRFGPFRLLADGGVICAADALRLAPEPGAADPGTRWVTFGDGALLVVEGAEAAGGADP